MYIRLAQIIDNEEFVQAAISMGWTKKDYKEILDDIGEYSNGYIVNQDKVKKNIKDFTLEKASVLCTIGSAEGQRWYENPLVAYRDSKGHLWAKEDEVDNF